MFHVVIRATTGGVLQVFKDRKPFVCRLAHQPSELDPVENSKSTSGVIPVYRVCSFQYKTVLHMSLILQRRLLAIKYLLDIDVAE